MSLELALFRMQNMPYPPPIPLPVPAAISAVPPEIVGLELDSLGLMSPEEQQSNAQLYHCVSPKSHPLCAAINKVRWSTPSSDG